MQRFWAVLPLARRARRLAPKCPAQIGTIVFLWAIPAGERRTHPMRWLRGFLGTSCVESEEEGYAGFSARRQA